MGINTIIFDEAMSRQDLPLELYSADQVRELDRTAIDEFYIPGYELMCRAGQSVFERVKAFCPEATSCTIFCGGGNNAGDGYVIARLAIAAGMEVTVYSVVEVSKLKGDALTAYRDCIDSGCKVAAYDTKALLSEEVIIDALLGTGLDREVEGLYADAIAAINASRAVVIAVDIPSGLNADTGKIMGCAVKADLTVSFIGLKKGLFTGDAPDYCGKIYYASLDIPNAVFDRVDCAAQRIHFLQLPRRSRCAHKGHHGHVLVIGGDLGYSGAIRMAGEAALRVGAGLVTVLTRPEHAILINSSRPELMCRGVVESECIEAIIDSADVLVLGPGLGRSDWSKGLFDATIRVAKPMVIDADGLNWLADSDQYDENFILTPHPGEASRLLKCSVSEVEHDRFAAVSSIRRQYGGICVLKGAGSLIASHYHVAVADVGNPGMATGGMGDVLTGVIAGLLAQGFSNWESAEQGVCIHGLAADAAADDGGERGLLATDLMPYLRRLVN